MVIIGFGIAGIALLECCCDSRREPTLKFDAPERKWSNRVRRDMLVLLRFSSEQGLYQCSDTRELGIGTAGWGGELTLHVPGNWTLDRGST
jgi:hypothetical protein